jgi:hypothetical protein
MRAVYNCTLAFDCHPLPMSYTRRKLCQCSDCKIDILTGRKCIGQDLPYSTWRTHQKLRETVAQHDSNAQDGRTTPLNTRVDNSTTGNPSPHAPTLHHNTHHNHADLQRICDVIEQRIQKFSPPEVLHFESLAVPQCQYIRKCSFDEELDSAPYTLSTKYGPSILLNHYQATLKEYFKALVCINCREPQCQKLRETYVGRLHDELSRTESIKARAWERQQTKETIIRKVQNYDGCSPLQVDTGKLKIAIYLLIYDLFFF